MGKVFRLHDNGQSNLAHWADCGIPYGDAVIDAIQDPAGGTAKKEITSIPSPFARLSLLKTAFREVCESKNLDGNTIYHKMVSDAMDVAEILFNYEKLSDKVDIIRWDIISSIQNLRASTTGIRTDGMNAHKIVADTLDIYINQDGKSYNFGKVQSFYLLRYKGANQKSDCDVIGATSPATLFFTTANDLSYITDITFDGNDKPFDKNFQPLYKRDFELVKYLWSLTKSYPTFANDFKEVYDYLQLTYKQMSGAEKTELDNVNPADYQPLVVDNNNIDIVNGLTYAQRPKIAFKSDFEIDSIVYNGDITPLVLPVQSGSMYSNLKYTTTQWVKDNKAPYYTDVDLSVRKLPFEGTQHPYLTISDFLNYNLIELDYNINKEKFFDGNFIGKPGSQRGFLLPINKLFFDFFSVEELMGKMKDGKNMIEIKEINDDVISVTLRIPIKSSVPNVSYIEYERKFGVTSIDKNANIGHIERDPQLEMALFPGFGFDENTKPFYRFATLGSFKNDYVVTFYDGAKSIQLPNSVARNKVNQKAMKMSINVIDDKRFDHCELAINGIASGILVPLLVKHGGGDSYSFAIDFGTTNTHIEYTVNNGPSKEFDITSSDIQISYINKDMDDQKRRVFDSELVPELISKDSVYNFPTRTVLSTSKDINWNEPVLPLANTSIAFTYGKSATYDYNTVLSNLKWDTTPGSDKKVSNYLETLMFMIRNKVLANNGTLTNTKVLWTYPLSMTVNQVSLFKEIWDKAYDKYVDSDTTKIKKLTESCAPYYFFKKQIGAVDRIVTIDIGGGTSDVVIAEGGEIKALTSFRYAANSIFGRGYNGIDAPMNALIDKYGPILSDVLIQNNMKELSDVYTQLYNEHESSEINAFLFSLKDNAEVKRKNVGESLDYQKMLQKDGSFKLIVLLFYSALIFHIAKVMKAKGLNFPRHIAFSGNGSKSINILSNDKDVLSKYTKLIFAKVYGSMFDGNLEMIIGQYSPKELTCKGGLSHISESNTVDLDDKIVYYKANGEFFSTKDKYKDVGSDVYASVEREVKEFFQLFFNLNDDFSFKKNFGVDKDSDLDDIKEHSTSDLNAYIMKGKAMKGVSDSDEVEETFFFYPFNGLLSDMIAKIVR
jgi:hypothetical protein